VTAIATDEQVVAEPPPPPRSLARDARDRLRRSKTSMICLAIVAVYALVGLATLTPIMDQKIEETVGASYAAPRLGWPQVWLGADVQGRSVFWRTLYGVRVALLITIGASVLSIGIGIVLGIVAGYFGGWIDAVIVWLFTTVSSVPWILMVISLAYALQSYERLNGVLGGLPVVIIALGLTDWVGLCRLLRGEVLKHRERDYVIAARAAGAGHVRILFQHILPNVFHLVIITFSLSAVGYVQAEVALTFLGLGITSKPSWGRMIDDAKLELLRGVWWQITAATVAIFVLCLALNILGDALRDALDPRLRGVD
jgi:peptide/nickel transport system permease protein